MRTRNIGRGVPALLLVTAGLALAACGPSDGSGSASGPSSPSAPSAPSASASSATPAPSSAPASTDTAPPAGTPSSSPAPGATRTASSAGGGTGGSAGAAGSTRPGCATGHLKITAEATDSGAGSANYVLVFQNTGSAPCTLTGYPGVSFVKIHNTQLGKAAARTGDTTRVVTLIPNAHAYADLRTVNGMGGYDAARCDLTAVPTLRVYPPNETESSNIPWNQQECVGPDVQNLRVGPVHTGR